MAAFLDTLLPYQTNVSPVFIILLVLVITLIVGLRLYVLYKENRNRRVSLRDTLSLKPGGAVPDSITRSGRTNRRELRFVASRYGLNREQADYFTELCVGNNIQSPLQLAENRISLEKLFTSTLHRLETLRPATRLSERRKTLLFTIREAIENHRREETNVSTTRSIRDNQPFTLVTPGGEHYPAVVINNSPDGLLCSIPRDFFGNELRLRIWSKIELLFSTSSGQSYRVTTRLVRYLTAGSETRMVLSHTESVTAQPNRQHERRQFRGPCEFSYVTVGNVAVGDHTEHTFYPDKKINQGTIIDLSSGGCSIESRTSFAAGDYLQISFKLREPLKDTVIGKVIRVNETGEGTWPVMHVRFAKMPRATMNRIFTWIYSHGERIK